MKKSLFVKKEQGKPFIARDGALIFELLRPETSEIKNMSIASGYLQPKQKALLHYHKKLEEVYYIISGRGKVRVGDSVENISEGVAVHIPIGVVHALENTSVKNPLKILAISSPPYRDDDMFFVDNQK